MIRRLALLSVLLAGNAWSQQNMDISEKDLGTSAAQARLSALARQAEITGGRVVVTAPQHLHAQIAAALRAGGSTDVVLKDGFYENVLVRIEEKAVEAPKPEPRPAPAAAAPRPAPAPVRAAPAPTPPPVAAPAQPVRAPEPEPAPPPAPVVEATPPPPAPVAQAVVAPELGDPPAAEGDAAAPAQAVPSYVFSASEPGDVVTVRKALESRYNDGKRIRETISPARLRRGDLVYTGDGAAVVVRRESTALLRFWLDGSLELRQPAISNESGNKYRVIGESVR